MVDSRHPIREYHHSAFLPVSRLLDQKKKTGNTVSLIIPALNESATVGAVIQAVKRDLMMASPLLDEIIVMDGLSSDETVRTARDAGATVFRIDEIDSDRGLPPGKGTAVWKSVRVARGDILITIDADVMNFDSRFIYGLVGPLLMDPTISFAKAYYKRPLMIGNNSYDHYGGRVTEIMVRPVLSMFYPELARIYQPLSGEYAFRRDLVEALPIQSGYALELGLILDIYHRTGLAGLAQVDMGIRLHRNRTVEELGKMSFEILNMILRKLEQDGAIKMRNPWMKEMVSPVDGTWEVTPGTDCEIGPLRKEKTGKRARPAAARPSGRTTARPARAKSAVPAPRTSTGNKIRRKGG